MQLAMRVARCSMSYSNENGAGSCWIGLGGGAVGSAVSPLAPS